MSRAIDVYEQALPRCSSCGNKLHAAGNSDYYMCSYIPCRNPEDNVRLPALRTLREEAEREIEAEATKRRSRSFEAYLISLDLQLPKKF